MFMSCVLLAALVTLVSVEAQQSDVKEVDVQQGRVKGRADYRLSQNQNQWVYSFKGIPYAKSPTEERRFKLPEEPESFGSMDASRDSIPCPQPAMFGSGSSSTNEDCLTLDIHVAGLDPNRLAKPVIVYFPGGGQFRIAKSSDYGPRYLLEQELILVVVNYRVGALGFMSTEDNQLPGNLGLFDQQMALKWISQNIRNFGGDSNKITLMGHDSGAASISMHMLHPDSQRLFHRAVVSGGSLFSPWAFQRSDAHRHANHFANQLGCHGNIVECLRGKSVNDILQMQEKQTNLTFLPVIDTNYTQSPFFKENPLTALEKGTYMPMPMLLGMTKDAAFFDFYKMQIELAKLKTPDEALTKFFKPIIFPHTVFDDFLYTWEKHQLDAVVKGIKYLYFRDIDVLKWFESGQAWVQAISDYLYKSGVDKFARVWSKKCPETYIYHLEYDSFFTFRKQANFGQQQSDFGPVHMDDVFYFFETPYYESTVKPPGNNDVPLKFRRELIFALNKFAKEGNLSRPLTGEMNEWLPYSINDTTLRITNSTKFNEKYKNHARFRAPQLDYFSVLVPDIVNRSTSNVYYESQDHVISYGGLTWALLALLLIVLVVAILFIVYKQKQKRKYKKDYDTVSTHVPAEKVEFNSKV